MADVERLLQEIATAPSYAVLDALEHKVTLLIDELTAQLIDAINERRDYLDHHL